MDNNFNNNNSNNNELSSNRIRCPICGNDNNIEYKYCVNCGNALPVHEQQNSQNENVKSNKKFGVFILLGIFASLFLLFAFLNIIGLLLFVWLMYLYIACDAPYNPMAEFFRSVGLVTASIILLAFILFGMCIFSFGM